MRWRKVAIWTLLVVLLLIVGLTILLFTTPAQQVLLRGVETVANRAGVPFKAEGLQLRPLDLSASFSKFDYDKNGITIHATNLKIELPWNAYGANGITVNSLTADEMQARFVSPESAPSPQSVTSGAPSSQESIALPLIRIGRLELKNGSFTYESSSRRVEIPSFSMNVVDGVGKVIPKAPVLIDAKTQVRIPEIPIELLPDGLRFGPVNWSVSGDQSGSGTVSGAFRWAPVLGGSANFATDPFDIDKWDGIVLRGEVRYEHGALTVPEFVATRGDAQVTGSASLSDSIKSAAVHWNDVRIDPSGVAGVTDGQLELQWQAADFSDAKGSGRASIRTEKYGTAQSDVSIADGRAHLAIEAAAMGAVIHADAITGLDRQLSGTFNLTHQEFGAISAEGTLEGTLTSPVATADITADSVTFKGIGPLRAKAQASYRDMVLLVERTEARWNNSELLDGSLRIDLESQVISGSAPLVHLLLNDFLPDGTGKIEAAAQISGSLDHPVASLSASSSGLDIGGTHIDGVIAAAQLKDNVLRVTQLDATQEQGVLRATGEANLETEQVTGEGAISNLQITQVRGLSGTLNLTANVAGSYRKPAAEVRGALADVIYEGQEHGTVQFAGTVNGETIKGKLDSPKYHASVDGSVALKSPYPFTADVTVDQGAFHYQQYDLTATGRAIAGGTLEPVVVDRLQLQAMKLTGEGVDLTASGSLETGIQTAGVADLAKLPLADFQLTGQAKISALVKGPLDSPAIDGALSTMGATVRIMGMPEPARVEAAVDFTSDRFTIREMRADYADAHVVIGGSGSLKGAGEFTFTAENIRPERFLPDRPLAGVVGLEGRVTLSAPRLDAIEGQASVTQLDIVAGGVQFHQTKRGEIALTDGALSIRNFALSGPETDASVNGSINVSAGLLNLDLRANTDLRILEGFIPRSNASGHVDSEIAIRGAYREPDMNGFVRLTEAQIQLSEPPLVVSDMNADVRLNGNRFQIQRAAGDLNGGAFDISGGGEISSAGLTNSAIHVTLKGTQLEYPEGLQSEVAANLALTGTAPNLTLVGNVDVLDALYRQDVDLREEVLRRLTFQQRSRAAQRSAFVPQINLDVTVQTTGAVAVANNVANLDLIGSFRVRGTIADPVVLGRASALEGGEVYFGPAEGAEAAALRERRDRYIVERGTVDFANSLQTEPTLDFEATHELQVKDERYLIRLRASGTPADLRTELTSDPYLSEPDIIAMLLTGRSFTDLQSAHLAVAREQLLNYLSGQLTSRFFRGAGSALGLDTVTIEPVTIASEEDVSARLTIGKDLTRDLSMIYSQNLAGARDQAWIVNYATFKDLVIRGINRTDQDQLRLELHHGLAFGGGPALPRHVTPREEARLQSVAFSGSTFSTEQLQPHVGKIGNPYNIYRMNDDVRSLRAFFSSAGYPEARVRARRTVSAGKADAVFTITQGPKVRFEFRGAPVPQSVQKKIVHVWETGFAEPSSLQESIRVLLRYFRDEGYLQADASGRNEAQNPDERQYVFQIESGTKFANPVWSIQGIEPSAITVTSAGETMESPEGVRDEIELELKGKGFLDATSTVPQLVMPNGAAPQFVVKVETGARYMVGALKYSGTLFFTDARLNRVVLVGPSKATTTDDVSVPHPPETIEPLKPFPYTTEWVGVARRRLLTEYWQQGFNDVQISSSTDFQPGSGKIEVTFEIREGERQQIADVQIHGDSKTLLSHLRRYFQFKQGDPVDYTRINLTRKKLYDTGLFKRVDIEVANEPGGYVANVNLNERAPWELRYGVTAADHRGQGTRDLGFSSDLTHRNVLGKGITAGISLKADPSLREGRLFSSFPIFLGRDVTSTGALFRTRETLADSVANTWGFTLQQQWRPSEFYLLSYDYSLRRIATFERDLTDDDPDINNDVVRVARFNATLSRDTRNDILNASRGEFLSTSLQLAPPGIGSSVRFVRNYAQYMRFKEVWRPNLIWASAYRVGLARSFGSQPLVETDQFNAADSLRAFGKDSLSFEPGNALLVMNQELRHPLFWRLGVAGFLDIGNDYERLGQIRVLEQRYSPGIGLRIDTPFTLLRVDWAFNPFPKPGENRRRLSFGIGQAF